jgi:hypothetical protein
MIHWPREASAPCLVPALEGGERKPAHRRRPAAGPCSPTSRLLALLLIQEQCCWHGTEQKRCHLVLQGKVKKSYIRRRSGDLRMRAGEKEKRGGIALCMVSSSKTRGSALILREVVMPWTLSVRIGFDAPPCVHNLHPCSHRSRVE